MYGSGKKVKHALMKSFTVMMGADAPIPPVVVPAAAPAPAERSRDGFHYAFSQSGIVPPCYIEDMGWGTVIISKRV